MSVSDVVRMYLKSKPYTLEALGSGIVNYSALARVIQKSLRIKNYGAVKAAVVRYAEHLDYVMGNIEKAALPVLKQNKLSLLDGITVIVADKKFEIENDAEVKIDSYHVYLTGKAAVRAMPKKERDHVVKLHEDCSAIILYSAEKLENIPGVMAFLTSLLAEQNINIVELISVYTETIFVVNKEDALRSYQMLSELIK
jgi:hypothetical protein